MTQYEVWLVAGMTVATFLCRYLVLAVVTRVHLPPRVQEAMQYIPLAVLAAIIAPVIFAPNGELVFAYQNSYLIAALASGIVAWRSRNLLLTTVVGMSVWWLWRWRF